MPGWSHPVASFWSGGDLCFIEQMVLLSYLEQGCDFTLYIHGPVNGIPAGVTVRDAGTIMALDAFETQDRHGLAALSDLFRIRLLRQQTVIWADLDAYCVAPYHTDTGYLFGRDDKDGVLTGVLALPQDCPALAMMDDIVSAGEIAPPWRGRHWVEARRAKGALTPATLPWGEIGPRLLTHAVQQHGLMHHAKPRPVFYPCFRQSLTQLWRVKATDADIIPSPDTVSVHVFGYTKRFLHSYHKGVPPQGSWLARMAARHGIDPAAAPAWGEPLPK